MEFYFESLVSILVAIPCAAVVASLAVFSLQTPTRLVLLMLTAIIVVVVVVVYVTPAGLITALITAATFTFEFMP